MSNQVDAFRETVAGENRWQKLDEDGLWVLESVSF